MVKVAVVPDSSTEVPCVLPSSVRVTDPVGAVGPANCADRVAVTCKGTPGAGVLVAGVTKSVVGLFETVMFTEAAVEAALLASPP